VTDELVSFAGANQLPYRTWLRRRAWPQLCRHADTTSAPNFLSDHYILCASQLVLRAFEVRRGKREPGVIPGLPRSGKWERPPSQALDQPGLGSDGQ
jgi:hypothetical protein